jgi:tetratricopeptide (TPR) repeat protein
MTALQLSPDLPAKCLNALLNNNPAVLDACQEQLRAMENSDRSDVNRLTAEDELGLALLRAPHPQSAEALRHFNAAIRLAPSTLTTADAECGYLY